MQDRSPTLHSDSNHVCPTKAELGVLHYSSSLPAEHSALRPQYSLDDLTGAGAGEGPWLFRAAADNGGLDSAGNYVVWVLRNGVRIRRTPYGITLGAISVISVHSVFWWEDQV